MLVEWIDYRRIHLEPSLIVDRSRGEKIVIEMDMTFPRVPCYCSSRLTCLLTSLPLTNVTVLSLDVMDISGEHQTNLEHDVSKTRLSKEGAVIESRKGRKSTRQQCVSLHAEASELALKGDVERANLNRDPSYCGSCYGATAPENG